MGTKDTGGTGGGGERAAPKRKIVRRGLTKAGRRMFLETLADTLCVSRAARAAGVSDQTARRLRARDEAFRAAWDAALADGGERLKERLAARAMAAVADGGEAAGGAGVRLAVEVARGHLRDERGRLAAAARRVTEREINEALLARLEALAARRVQS